MEVVVLVTQCLQTVKYQGLGLTAPVLPPAALGDSPATIRGYFPTGAKRNKTKSVLKMKYCDSRRMAEMNLDYIFFIFSTSNSSCHGSPISLPLQPTRSPLHRTPSQGSAPTSTRGEQGHRASVENLSDFLSKMDTSIAVNKKASISLIKSSKLQPDEREGMSGRQGGVEFLTNNNSSDGRGQRGVHGGGVGSGYQGDYDNIC